MAGYSQTPLLQKLGIRDGDQVAFLRTPANYRKMLGPLPTGAKIATGLKPGLDFIHFFAEASATLDAMFPSLKESLAPDGMLWISWPKQASGIRTDLNENVIREFGLSYGLVDVKVCAIDDTWSALKFVYRLADRPQ